jgi:hypothetical protein
MKIELCIGILSMHGKIGKVYFRTMKNGTVVMCRMPRKAKAKTVSESQQKHRERFSIVVKKVNEVMKDAEQRGAMEVLYKQYGNKHETLRGFVFRHINNLLSR